ncbi:hypothetical protein ERO13_D13G082600v2 [Gossypium hirsutum]|nr:hypothetical protein ERO13_D13G082600v2 [Gossypium hirsutum]TYG36870.1 hypothetical protein ES288_D13G097700v1 [Gossypium darwinii]TYH34003.1 hypothetical protein ES332_D13G098200v1 [Gossypium tomentosum]
MEKSFIPHLVFGVLVVLGVSLVNAEDPCISPGLLLMVLVLFLEFPGNDGSMSEADEPSYNEDGKW